MMIRKILLISFLTMLPFLATALPFNSKLTETDAATVQNGEVLIKSIDKAKNMAIESQNPGVQKLVDLVKDHAPNYLAEIIQVKPVSGNEDLAERLSAVLEDVEGYAGIPYWSVHHERYFDLYETAVIDSQKMLDEHTKLIDASIDIGITFYFYTPPYSILYWDDCIRRGQLAAQINAMGYAYEKLLSYDNVRVFFFMDDYELITDLEHYRDYSHYDQSVNHYMYECMRDGKRELRSEDIFDTLTALQSYAAEYDYEAIFR